MPRSPMLELSKKCLRYLKCYKIFYMNFFGSINRLSLGDLIHISYSVNYFYMQQLNESFIELTAIIVLINKSEDSISVLKLPELTVLNFNYKSLENVEIIERLSKCYNEII